MHIIFLQRFTPKHTYGGAEVSAWYIARGLIKLGHQVEIFCQGSARSQKSYLEEGIMIHPVPGLFGRNILTLEKRWAKKQAKILKKHLPKKFDLLHSHDQHSLLINAELETEVKRLHTVRDYTPICGYNHLKIDDSICPKCSWQNFKTCPKIVQGNLLQKPLRIFRFLTTLPYHQECLSKLVGVVFISHFLKKEILQSPNWRKDIPKPKQTAVIYNPVPIYTQPLDQNTQHNYTNLLFIGRLEKHKGLNVLLKALSKLGSSFRLAIIGQGELEYYKKLAKSLQLKAPQIQFLGQIPHHLMPDIYRKSDMLISPHIWPEPFGRTIIEAMSFNKIVIASNYGGPREIIQDNKNGFLVPSNDYKALQKKILTVSNNKNLQAQIKKEAQRTIRKSFTPLKIAKQYLDFYLSLTNP